MLPSRRPTSYGTNPLTLGKSRCKQTHVADAPACPSCDSTRRRAGQSGVAPRPSNASPSAAGAAGAARRPSTEPGGLQQAGVPAAKERGRLCGEDKGGSSWVRNRRPPPKLQAMQVAL